MTLARQLFIENIRKFEPNFQYFYVLEFNQAKTQPHLHLLARSKYIPQSTLSDLWEKATTSARMKPARVVWIETPHSTNGSVNYILDYAFTAEKNQDVPESWRGRKIGYSQKWFYKPAREIWKAHIEFLHPDVSRETTEKWVIDKQVNSAHNTFNSTINLSYDE